MSSLTDNVKINLAKSSRLSKPNVASFHLMRSDSVVKCLTRDRGFEPHRRHCVVSLSENTRPNPSLVLVQPRKTRSFITERFLKGRKESNQTNKLSTGYSQTHVRIQRWVPTPPPPPPPPLENHKVYGFL